MIISLLITIISLLLIAGAVLVGLKRGTIKAAIKAGGYIISALLAFLLAKPISFLFLKLSDFIIGMLKSNVEGFSDITDASPTLVQLITKLPIAILTPILFVILFFTFLLITNIVLKLTLKKVYKMDPCKAEPLGADATDEEVEKRKADVSRSLWIGRAINIVPGLVLIFVLFLPVAGYLNLTSQTIDAVALATENQAKVESNIVMLSNNNSDNSVMNKINDDYIKPANKNFFIKAVYTLGGKASFNSMTSFKLDGDKVSLTSEVATFSKVAENIQKLGDKPIKEYTKEQTDAVQEITEQFENSINLPKITAEVISFASTKWSNNEKFFGMEKPDMSDNINPLLNKILEIFKTETDDTIKADLNTLTDVFIILIEKDVLASLEDQDALIDKLSTKGLITSLLTTISANDRMAVLTNEITNMGVRAIASALKIPADKIAVYEDVVNSIKESAINTITSDMTNEEKVTALSESLNNVFADNGMDVSSDITPIVAQAIIDKFKDQDDISSEEMDDFFILLSGVYQEDSNNNPNVNKSIDSPYKYLAVSGDANIILCSNTSAFTYEEFVSMYEKNKDKFSSDRYKLKEGMTTRDLYNQIIDDLNLILGAVEKIKALGSAVNPAGLISLSTPSQLQTTTTTIDDLMLRGEEPVINRENAEAEGAKLEAAMGKASLVITSINKMNKAKDEGKNSLESMRDFNFNAMGDMLDILGSTTAFENSTDSIAESMLNGVTGQNSGLAAGMRENGTTYGNLFQSVGDTTQALLGATDDSQTEEERLANVERLMNNLTPGNANIISNIISPKFIQDQGVPAANSNKTSLMIKTLFIEMSKVKGDDVAKEADAVKYLFDIGMSAKKDSTTPLFGANGKIKDTNDFVKRSLTSTVTTNTLKASTFDENGNVILDPIGIKTKISLENQNELIVALEKYITDNSVATTNTEAVKNIVALAAMFNIETNVGATQITFTAK